jgi:hypothetical protein
LEWRRDYTCDAFRFLVRIDAVSGKRTSKPWLWGVVASAALHLAVVWWVPRRAAPNVAEPATTIELSLIEHASLADEVADNVGVSDPAPPAPKSSRARPQRSEPAATGAAVASTAVSDATTATESAEIEPVQATAPVETAANVPNASLAPRAVAQAWLGHSERRCPEPLATERCASETDAGSADVTAQPVGPTREVPLRRRPDGSYEYESDAFTAVIAPDGSVQFEDRLGEGTLGPVGLYDDDTHEVRVGVMLTINFDFDDFVEKVLLDKSLYPAAKARFIEQTQALRAELSAKYYAAGAARAHLTLHRELMRVLRDDTLDARNKRLAVFMVWDDCAQDEQGTQAQHAVERFIREHMPQGSTLGYSADELLALNAQRAGARPFAPYAN